jgi:hypothetical protein
VARIILASYVVRMPVGGYQSWMLQWMLGFRRLGHDVYFVEKSGWANSCIDPRTWETSDDCSRGTAAWNATLARFGFERNWCYVDAAGNYHGMSRECVEPLFRGADLFLDFMRDCEWREEAQWVGARVMMDGEPAFAQMLMEKRAARGVSLASYDHYFTVGLNIGTPRSTAPTAGRTWRPVFDPVDLDFYTVEPAPEDGPFTSVMSWQAQKPIYYGGKAYEGKDVEFPKFVDLPRRAAAPLELAISGENVPADELLRHGWRLRPSGEATLTLDRWRDYIRCSRGEFSVQKGYYVSTNSGAFSDRSAVYLASGRPVVMQETGFSEHLPCGRGLFAVRDVDDASAAIAEIQGSYKLHSKWARELAAEYLSAPKVAAQFLAKLGL